MSAKSTVSSASHAWPAELPAFLPLAAAATLGPPAVNRELPGQLETICPGDLDQWIARIESSGLQARRFGSPDLLEQLRLARGRRIDAVICHALDSDPAARILSTLAARFPLEIIAAGLLLRRLLDGPRLVFAVDQVTPAAWLRRFRRLAKTNRCDWVAMPNDYPQSDPVLLLYSLLNRRLQPGQLPPEENLVVLDAAAALGLGQQLFSGHQPVAAPVAVHDHMRHQVHYFAAAPGTRLQEILRHCPGDANGQVLCGDLLRQRPPAPADQAGNGELLLHLLPPEHSANPRPCIRCGWCAEGCPTRAQPAGLLEAAQLNDLELARHHGLNACIECGICSYICPSRLPLLQAIRALRNS